MRTLRLTFITSEGSTMTLSYNHMKSEVTQEQVTTLMNTIIANGSIFKEVPVSKKSAVLRTTSDQEFTTE